MDTAERFAESLVRAHQHWNATHGAAPAHRAAPTDFTIAFSRECGTYGAAIARTVGDRLGWPVYDSELLQHIADEMGVHRKVLESVDERRENWLCECLEGFLATPHVDTSTYFRRLIETMLTLGSHGNCVIVGRGATRALPADTTLRVRIVAPLEHRISAIQKELNLPHKEAALRVAAVDRERDRFVESHFGINPADPSNYDIILNAGRFSPQQGAEVVLAALELLRKKTNPASVGAS